MLSFQLEQLTSNNYALVVYFMIEVLVVSFSGLKTIFIDWFLHLTLSLLLDHFALFFMNCVPMLLPMFGSAVLRYFAVSA